MAKLNEQTITIKISELLRDNENAHTILSQDEVDQLIAVIQELVGQNKIIEVE
jgi:hypothetical protein